MKTFDLEKYGNTYKIQLNVTSYMEGNLAVTPKAVKPVYISKAVETPAAPVIILKTGNFQHPFFQYGIKGFVFHAPYLSSQSWR